MSDRRPRDRRSRSRSPVIAKKEPANEQREPIREQQQQLAVGKDKEAFTIDREKVGVWCALNRNLFTKCRFFFFPLFRHVLCS